MLWGSIQWQAKNPVAEMSSEFPHALFCALSLGAGSALAGQRYLVSPLGSGLSWPLVTQGGGSLMCHSDPSSPYH